MGCRYDGAPALIDVKQGGKTIPAVAAINKVGLLFLLDRVTGKPIYGVEERPVPASEVPLERASKTQPFPVKPPPLSRMTMKPEDVATVTPELEKACKELMQGMELGGPYLPVSYNKLRVQFPGNHGGVNWFGTSFNPQLGYLFINSNELGQMSGLRDHDKAKGRAAADGQGNRVDPEGPYEGVPGGGRFSVRGAGLSAVAVPAAAVGESDGGECEYRRIRVAGAAGGDGQSAGGQAEDGASGERGDDCDGGRTGVRGGDR